MECLERFGGGISRIEIYSGFAIDVPPCAPMSQMSASYMTLTDKTADGYDAPRLLLAYDAAATDDAEMDTQTPASAKIVQQLAQQGLTGTVTVQALITANDTDAVQQKVLDMQDMDLLAVFTLMDGSRHIAYMLPGTSMITAEPVKDEEAKLTLSLTGKTMSLFVRLT